MRKLYLKGYRTNDWRWAHVKGTYAWYDRLFEDEDFLQRYIDVNRLKRWISGRLAWIDSQGFPPAAALEPRLSMTYHTGKIFYTTDGTDLRLRGGPISPAAN